MLLFLLFLISIVVLVAGLYLFRGILTGTKIIGFLVICLSGLVLFFVSMIWIGSHAFP